MNTTHDDNAATWRDLADDLTHDQLGSLLNFEKDALGDPADVAEGLLEQAREHIRQNKIDAERFGHLPTPAQLAKRCFSGSTKNLF